MTEAFKFNKRLTPDAEDLVLRVLVPDAAGKAFHPMTFMRERIDYVTEVSEAISGIALKSGVKIPVAMPYEDLEKKIYFADIINEPVLDLRNVTGPAVADAALPKLSADFNTVSPAAEGAKPLVDRELTIAAFVRQKEEQNFQMFFVKDTNINWAGVAGEDGRNGKMTTLPLRYGKGPFGETTIQIDIPRPAFMELYNKAKLDGQDTLDLRDWTRRRDPDGHKPPIP